MTKQLICAILLGMSLQGCFALRMEIEDPLGLPESDALMALHVDTEAIPPQHQANPILAKQLHQDLKRLLPRERHVKIVAGCTPQEQCKKKRKESTLVLKLSQAQQELHSPQQVFGPPATAPQIRMELRLQGQLISPHGKAIQHIDLVQRGSGLKSAQELLEQQLLQRLRGRLLQKLQAQYRYYWD